MKKEIFFAITLLILVYIFFILPTDNTDININGIKTLNTKDYVSLTNEEAEHIINFLTDYLVFSEEGRLDVEDRGFPKQFYLYDKDKVISLGKMLFLFFQRQTYEAMDINDPHYFIPKKQSFKLVGRASDVKEGYKLALNGNIPKKVSGMELQDFIYQILVKGGSNFNYDIDNLNTEHRGIEIAFTFDIESGRYVSEASEVAISPCKDENYSLGLEEGEKICGNPAYVAWMSPRDDKITYTQYLYPQVSGILGFMEILNYSERYGIPTTNFIVKKDIVAFNILDTELVNKAKSLIKKGLFEVGSHTRYHTHLGHVDEKIAKKELIESKLFLEKFFNTTVSGFRAPYLSILKDDETYVKALEEAGYTYYSSYPNEGWYSGKVPGYQIVHKPWNMERYAAYITPKEFREMIGEKEYIIALDHPWDMVYQDGNVLVEDPELRHNYRAIVLTAISNGGIPVLLRDLKV